MEEKTILIVDDENDIRDLIEIYLKNEGYRTITASDGDEAIEKLKSVNVDLVILDIMMPEKSGIQVCVEMRENMDSDIPIIILSAKGEDGDKVLGLGTGADDYITKPFSHVELIARVKAQIRRHTKLNYKNITFKEDENEFSVSDIIINTLTHKVWVNEKEVNLTPHEFDILELFMRNKGIVLSMEKIYESVWHEPFYVTDSIVAVHIRNLREKIGDSPKDQKYIKTVWGVGYKIED